MAQKMGLNRVMVLVFWAVHTTRVPINNLVALLPQATAALFCSGRASVRW